MKAERGAQTAVSETVPFTCPREEQKVITRARLRHLFSPESRVTRAAANRNKKSLAVRQGQARTESSNLPSEKCGVLVGNRGSRLDTTRRLYARGRVVLPNHVGKGYVVCRVLRVLAAIVDLGCRADEGCNLPVCSGGSGL